VDGLWAKKIEDVGLIVRAISFQDFHQRYTQTDRHTQGLQTDRRTTCDRKTALFTIVHRAVIKMAGQLCICSPFEELIYSRLVASNNADFVS